MKNFLLTLGSSWLARILALASQLLSIPLMTRALGVEQYALIAYMISLFNWMVIFELGLSSSVQNLISERIASDQQYTDILIGSAAISSVALAVGIPFLWIVCTHFHDVLIPGFEFISQERKITLLHFCVAIGMVWAYSLIVQKIYYAQNKGYLVNVALAINSLLTYLGLLVVNSTESLSMQDKTTTMFVVLIGLPCLSMGLLGWLTYRSIQFVNFSLSRIVATCKQIFQRAWGFAALTFFAAVVLQADYYFIAQYLQERDIAMYSILSKLFLGAFAFYTAVLMAAWSRFTRLRMLNQQEKISNIILLFMVFGVCLICVFAFTLFLFSREIFSYFLSHAEFQISIHLLLLMTLYFCIRIVCDTYSIYFQSISRTKILVISAGVQAVISPMLQYYFVQTYGMHGIVIALILTFALTVLWWFPYQYRKINTKVIH